jgi:hypothetical protein
VSALLYPILLEVPAVAVDELRCVTIEVAMRIDTASGSPRDYCELAADLGALLEHVPLSDVLNLTEAVVQRRRTSSLIEKHLSGVVSRTSLLSFVAEQRWPRHVKETVVLLDRGALQQLLDALSVLNLSVLRALLLRSEPENPTFDVDLR